MAFFDRFSVISGSNSPMFAFDSSCVPDCRIFTFKVNFQETKLVLNGYNDARWVKLDKLRKFRFFPDCVTIVKEMQFFFEKSVQKHIF